MSVNIDCKLHSFCLLQVAGRNTFSIVIGILICYSVPWGLLPFITARWHIVLYSGWELGYFGAMNIKPEDIVTLYNRLLRELTKGNDYVLFQDDPRAISINELRFVNKSKRMELDEAGLDFDYGIIPKMLEVFFKVINDEMKLGDDVFVNMGDDKLIDTKRIGWLFATGERLEGYCKKFDFNKESDVRVNIQKKIIGCFTWVSSSVTGTEYLKSVWKEHATEEMKSMPEFKKYNKGVRKIKSRTFSDLKKKAKRKR